VVELPLMSIPPVSQAMSLEGFAIKEPVFSFNKFPNVDKQLGPEMKSTGDAIRFIKDLKDPYFRKLYKERSRQAL